MRLRIIIGLIFFTTDIFACSCGHVGIVKNKKATDYSFKGRVIKLEEIITIDTITGTNSVVDYRRTRYTFEILRNYKGLKGKGTVYLITSGMTDCGVNFEKDEVYIVYAYNDRRKLHSKLEDQETETYITTHLCTRTKKKTMLTFLETFILRLT